MTFVLNIFFPLKIQVLTPDTIYFLRFLKTRLTGFYMRATLALNGLIPIIANRELYWVVSILSDKRELLD